MFAEKAEPAAFNEIIKGDDSNCNEKLGKISPRLCLIATRTIRALSPFD
jgi:hypothetical protein